MPTDSGDSLRGRLAAATPAAVSDDVLELRREISGLNDRLRRFRSKYGILREALLDVLAENPPRISAPPRPARDRRRREERTAVLHVSDLQLGKRTATYDLEVAGARLHQLAEITAKITETQRSAYKIEECRLYLGGDLVEGERIFRGQAHLIDRSLLGQAVREGPALVVRLILDLLATFRTVHVIAVSGNHGRVDFEAHPETNWDTVAAEIVRTTLLGSPDHPRLELEDRLTFHVSTDWHHVDRMPGGWGNLLIHGHQIRGGFAGFPWYGAGRKALGWFQVVREPWDYLWLGHFHTAAMATINYTEWRANGTTESGNDYAAAELASAGYPSQRLAFFNAEHGLVQEHVVYLTSPGERRPAARRFEP